MLINPELRLLESFTCFHQLLLWEIILGDDAQGSCGAQSLEVLKDGFGATWDGGRSQPVAKVSLGFEDPLQPKPDSTIPFLGCLSEQFTFHTVE